MLFILLLRVTVLCDYMYVFGVYAPQSFRCTNGDVYAALGSSMGLTLLVWVGGGLLRRVLYFFGDKPNLG